MKTSKTMSPARRERHDALLRDLQDLGERALELMNDSGCDLRRESMYEARNAIQTASRLVGAVLMRDDAHKGGA